MELNITLPQLIEMDIGYVFGEPAEGFEHSSNVLGINLFAQPTHHHFDPKQLILPVIDLDDHIAPMTMAHPWHNLMEYQLAAGIIEIIDRKDQKVEAFSFGGTLKIKVTEKRTSCLIYSPAPILSMETISNMNVGCLLPQEVQDLLAMQRAAYLSKHSAFAKKLKTIPPLTLFVSALKSINNKYALLPHEDSPHINDCHRIVSQALTRVIKQHPQLEQTPLIQDLL